MCISYPKKIGFPLMIGCIIRIISWLGCIELSERPSVWDRIIPIITNGFLILVFTDSTVLLALTSPVIQWKVFLVLSICSTFTFVSIYSILFKKKNFSATLYSNFQVFACKGNQRFNILAGCLTFLLVIYPSTLIVIYYMENDHEMLRMYSYQMEADYEWMRFCIVYIKIALLFFIIPVLPSIFAVLYCTQCHQCCLALEAITLRMIKCSPLDFTTKAQTSFLLRREDVIKMLDDIQDVYSVVSFTICGANFCSCLGCVTLFLTVDRGANHLPTLVEAAFTTIVSLAFLVLVFWTAGGVPLEMKKFRNVFQKKLKKRALLGFSFEAPGMELFMLAEEDYEMSGCGLLAYRRGLILGVLGSILTYGLLILSIKIHQNEVP